MGWDVYCCICGNACKSLDIGYLKELFSNTDITDVELKYIIKKTKWIKKSITLLSNNKILKKVERCEQHLPFKDDIHYGIFMHLDCWKFVKNTLILN